MKENEKVNASIDIMKFIMAILVVGIHTEPFGFNIWLDRGFGIITRLCVPFFFVTSAYFYWLKNKGPLQFLKRIISLYIIWSIIYLPFDVSILSKMSLVAILDRYLWAGNAHALWYLCGSTISFVITYFLLKIFKPRTILIIAFILLLIGCMKSTWSPLFRKLLHLNIQDWLGSRNGLFYAFPYTALGMVIAKRDDNRERKKALYYFIGLIISLIALTIESVVFVIVFNTTSTILWVSVFPYSYFLFMWVKNIEIKLGKSSSMMYRKLSTIIYVSQFLFITLFEKYLKFISLFAVVSLSTIILGIIIIELSKIKKLRWFKYLY